MDGIQIDYTIKKNMSSRFSQKMFGRISSRKSDNMIYSYYIPGILNEVPYTKIFDGRLFTINKKVDFGPVMPYVDSFVLSSACKDDEDILMRTGNQKWKFHVKERGLNVGNFKE